MSDKHYLSQEFWSELIAKAIIEDVPFKSHMKFRMDSKNSAHIEAEIPRDIYNKLGTVTAGNPMAEYVVFLSAFCCLLGKYGMNNVFIASENIGGEKGLLYFPYNVDENDTFKHVTDNIKSFLQKAMPHKSYHPEDVKETLLANGFTHFDHLHEIGFSYKKVTHISSEAPGFGLMFALNESGTHIRLSYDSKSYNEVILQGFLKSFVKVLENVLIDPNTNLTAIKLLSGSEEQAFYTDLCGTKSTFGLQGKTLQGEFALQVQKSADKIAVHDGEKCVSYKELETRANQLAQYLVSVQNVREGQFVGICMERSIDMVVGVLAIIKSGAAYVAIDPTYPKDRVMHMLEDSNTSVLITDEYRKQLFRGYRNPIINMTTLSLDEFSFEPLGTVSSESSPVYVVYTSGSTGTPNGAVLSNSLLLNLVHWQQSEGKIDQGLRCLQFTSLNFCVSFQEIFYTLLTGGTLYLIDDVERRNASYLMNFLTTHQIEILYLPFSYLNFLFIEYDQWKSHFKSHLKHLVTAGEQLKISPALKTFLAEHPEVWLHNHYGSSEMHVVSSYSLNAETCENYPIPPVGKPIANTSVYILDDYGNSVPVGVFGELYIEAGGELLGYINNPGLTQQKMLKSQFNPEKLYYKTGDLGRWLPDGNIEYKGRKDKQLKIRGFRVEPGEIESFILRAEGVLQCVVVDHTDRDDQKILVAYMSVKKRSIELSELRENLQTHFPSYMVPELIVLDNIPLMPNGKVDRDALPEPVFVIQPPAEYIEAQTETEKVLVSIWEEVLQKDRISILDNFFEIGGHSLKATKVMTRVHEEIGLKMPLKRFFKVPVLTQFALEIDTLKTSELSIEENEDDVEELTL